MWVVKTLSHIPICSKACQKIKIQNLLWLCYWSFSHMVNLASFSHYLIHTELAQLECYTQFSSTLHRNTVPVLLEFPGWSMHFGGLLKLLYKILFKHSLSHLSLSGNLPFAYGQCSRPYYSVLLLFSFWRKINYGFFPESRETSAKVTLLHFCF